MKLTSQEVEQFKRVGYLKIDGRVIDDEHLTVLREHYDAQFSQRRGTIGEGLRNLAVVGESESDEDADREEEMLQIMEMWRIDEEYRKLLYHEPLLDIVESLIGYDIQLFHDQALYKPAYHGGEVYWHQDNAYWQCVPPNLVSIWLALDDADEEERVYERYPRQLFGRISIARTCRVRKRQVTSVVAGECGCRSCCPRAS